MLKLVVIQNRKSYDTCKWATPQHKMTNMCHAMPLARISHINAKVLLRATFNVKIAFRAEKIKSTHKSAFCKPMCTENSEIKAQTPPWKGGV